MAQRVTHSIGGYPVKNGAPTYVRAKEYLLSFETILVGGAHPGHTVIFAGRDLAPDITRGLDKTRTKARNKQKSDAPLVLCVGHRMVDLSEFSWQDVVYGIEKYLVDPSASRTAPLPRSGGLLTSRTGKVPRAQYLSAVVTSPFYLSPNDGCWHCDPTAYLHPFAASPIDPEPLSELMPVWVPDEESPGTLVRRDDTTTTD